MVKRVALVTCQDANGLGPDDRRLITALGERGIEAEAVVWNDPAVDWNSYDLSVVRSTWDYPRHVKEFVKWAQSVPHLANDAKVIEWNTDRRYLKQLRDAGVPVVDTIWLDPEAHLSKRAIHSRMPAFGDFVVKPVVGANAEDVGRYQPISAESRAKAISHAQRLLDSGRWVMIQPYITSIDTQGETCLTFINDEFQHAVRRKALLGGSHRQTVGLSLYAEEGMQSVAITDEQLAVAKQAIAAAHKASGSSEPFLYARVDLVNGDGTPSSASARITAPTTPQFEGPLVVEIELTDPALWLRHSLKNTTLPHFADAIAERLEVAPDSDKDVHASRIAARLRKY